MSDRQSVQTSRGFLQQLEGAEILRHDELQTARWMSRETANAQMLARRLAAKGLLTRWQVSQLLRGREKLRFGNYKLCEEIGRGPYGRVFLAEHIQLHRAVAIKILSRRLTRDKTVLDCFLKDAGQAAELNHPNVARVLDIDNAQDRYYMVMEYVSGEDLQRRIQQNGRLSAAEVSDYLVQAAQGIHSAHRAGVVHGDLCPANLMREETGLIKVVGWATGGMAVHCLLAERSHHSSMSSQLAEAGDRMVYQPPERQGGEQPADVRSDLYSLGCTAGYLLTGDRPSLTPTDAARAEASGLPSAFDWERAGGEIPRTLIEVIERLMAVEPAERFESAREIGLALESGRDQDSEDSGYPDDSEYADDSEYGEDSGYAEEAEEANESEAVSVGPAHPDESLGGLLDSRGTGDVAEVPIDASDPLLELRGGSSSRGRRFQRGPRTMIGAGVAVAAIGLLSAMAVQWFKSAGTDSATWDNSPRAVTKPTESSSSRPALTPRRQTRATALKTSLPEAGAAGGVSEEVGESVNEEKPEAMEDAAGVDGSAKTAGGDANKTAAKEPSDQSAKTERKASEQASADTPGASQTDAPPLEKPADGDLSLSENPFQDLSPVVELPPCDPADEGYGTLDLGSLALDVAGETKVALLGGTHATKRAGQFVLETSDLEGGPIWRVLFGDPEKGPEEARELATLRIRDSRLRFAWDDAASQCPAAACLGNCVLRFSRDKHVHELRLRRAKMVEPLKVDLQRAVVKQRWPLPAMPDREQVRFEITQLADPFPHDYNLNPVQPIPAHGTQVMLWFGSENVEHPVLRLALSPQLQSTFRLECKVFFRVTPRVDWIPLTAEKFQTVESFVKRKQRSDNQRAAQARNALSRLPRKSPKRAALKKACEALEAELAGTSRTSTRLETLRQIRGSMAEGAMLHFRLYYLANDCEVDLVRTETGQ